MDNINLFLKILKVVYLKIKKKSFLALHIEIMFCFTVSKEINCKCKYITFSS